MRSILLVVTIILSLLSGCATKPLPPVAVNIPTRTIHYLAEGKPLLEKRCTVCHSCCNSPCQLKLDSYEGADRGLIGSYPKLARALGTIRHFAVTGFR